MMGRRLRRLASRGQAQGQSHSRALVRAPSQFKGPRPAPFRSLARALVRSRCGALASVHCRSQALARASWGLSRSQALGLAPCLSRVVARAPCSCRALVPGQSALPGLGLALLLSGGPGLVSCRCLARVLVPCGWQVRGQGPSRSAGLPRARLAALSSTPRTSPPPVATACASRPASTPCAPAPAYINNAHPQADGRLPHDHEFHRFRG